jgi:hypothetical protein
VHAINQPNQPTLLYWILEPSCKVTVLAAASMPVTVVSYCCFSLGSRAATLVQMAPVPPSFGKRNTAFGPQPLSVLFLRYVTLRYDTHKYKYKYKR